MTGTRIAAHPPFTRWPDAYDWVEAHLDYLTHARYDGVLAAATAIDHATYRNERITTQGDALLAAVNAVVTQTSYTEVEDDICEANEIIDDDDAVYAPPADSRESEG